MSEHVPVKLISEGIFTFNEKYDFVYSYTRNTQFLIMTIRIIYKDLKLTRVLIDDLPFK